MSQLLHVEIPNFGSSVLESLNEQRLQGQYCDVAVMVNGQAFKAHRAVLAASSLYFRDLFSGSSQSLFELPSSVTPSCFQQILSFCYTGRLTMAASEQLVLMYTAGYLQIQNIVERGMDLMLKANSPHCDSQTATSEDLGFEPSSPNNNNHPAVLPGDTQTATCRIKQERCESPMSEEHSVSGLEGHTTRSRALFYMGAGGSGIVPGVQSYPLVSGERSSPGASSLPATDSPTSHPNEDEEFEEEFYSSSSNTNGAYGQSNSYSMQDNLDVLTLPLATERRPCVLIGRDTMALPASLISQIGYRCHPTLYTEGDPGEKVELVGGSGVFMTRGQLMNCHLCAGIKHKVLLRRLLATFFDRNTLANSCGTGIRSSTNDPSRKPLDNRVLNTVKLYCQNFAPNFKESEMNVIAADMCTNARRVRKRWLPKIQSMLPETKENSRSSSKGQSRTSTTSKTISSAALPFEMDFRHLTSSYLTLEQQLYAESRKETLLPHLQFVGITKSEDWAASTRLAESGTEAGPEREGREGQVDQETEPNSELSDRAPEDPSVSPQCKAGARGSPFPKHTGQQEDKLLGDDQ
ncbi:nucleus accumbens-associated protein 2 isoform X1 [Esox lucius]|uniref:NACC family member 2 n=1 Tax=Esox lucius TaxID=8010 RepID=A0A3P9AGW3_ESOLU|nr:nucleus accumbens-associated protein 2 isoform X1 [Esox lucius]XP_034152522.1 nucleus accumbens-associated protein 2 isoform X1 [Esox lucius]